MCDPQLPRLDRRALIAAGAGAAAAVVVPPALTTSAAAGAEPASYHFSGRFNGVQAPWHYLPFDVPAGVQAIDVSYDFQPLDTGLGFTANVVDIGIFDQDGTALGSAAGFRGWSGGARRSFRVATDSATPGYLAGPIDPGVWRVALGPFAVVPPGVDWTVEVTLTYGAAVPAPEPTPPPRAIEGTGEGWYRGDLHLHTVHSDGRHTQASLVALAREAGLDFIGSSEHNTSSAPLTWGAHVSEAEPPLVLCGEEVTTRNGHWIAAGVPAGTWVDWRYTDRATLARFTQQVQGLGGLAVACHPWAPTPGSTWGFGLDLKGMDAVELWNGPWTVDDQVAVAQWHTWLTTGRFVPAIGSSDSHHTGQVVGRPHSVVKAATLSVPAIVDGLRSGRSWLAESSVVGLTFEASADGRTATCGERLGARGGQVVPVRLEVTGAPRCVVQVLGPLAPIGGALTDAAGNAVVSVRVPTALAPWVRAEVRRLDTPFEINPLEGVPALQMVALTNPIRLTGSWAARG